MFNLKLWNTSAVTEKFAPDVKFTQPEFPLIKLDKFVHSHLNLFICLSFLFFPNQTFLLKPARKTIDFFFSFCKFCLRFILLRPEFSSKTPTWNSSIGFVPYNHYAQPGGFPRRPTGNMKQTKEKKVDTNVFLFIPDLSTHLPEYSRKCGAFRAALNIQHISTYIRHRKVLVDILALLDF